MKRVNRPEQPIIYDDEPTNQDLPNLGLFLRRFDREVQAHLREKMKIIAQHREDTDFLEAQLGLLTKEDDDFRKHFTEDIEDESEKHEFVIMATKIITNFLKDLETEQFKRVKPN